MALFWICDRSRLSDPLFCIHYKGFSGNHKRNLKYFPLAFPGPGSHNKRMKNKNETNYTVKQLTDKIAELNAVKYPNDPSMKWAYTCGVLESILDWEVKGYNKGFQTLQETINQAFLRYEQELLGELELAASRD